MLSNYKPILVYHLQIDSHISLTYWSSCSNSVDRDSTQVSRDESCGSIFPHTRDTTDIAEWRVSLWTWDPYSVMNVRTQLSPPASNTALDSRVQILSSTLKHKQISVIYISFSLASYLKAKCPIRLLKFHLTSKDAQVEHLKTEFTSDSLQHLKQKH